MFPFFSWLKPIPSDQASISSESSSTSPTRAVDTSLRDSLRRLPDGCHSPKGNVIHLYTIRFARTPEDGPVSTPPPFYRDVLTAAFAISWLKPQYDAVLYQSYFYAQAFVTFLEVHYKDYITEAYAEESHYHEWAGRFVMTFFFKKNLGLPILTPQESVMGRMVDMKNDFEELMATTNHKYDNSPWNKLKRAEELEAELAAEVEEREAERAKWAAEAEEREAERAKRAEREAERAKWAAEAEEREAERAKRAVEAEEREAERAKWAVEAEEQAAKIRNMVAQIEAMRAEIAAAEQAKARASGVEA
ncbi:hypothetical protein CVT24_007364 [Panaeolus cyanescens]|uniref:Uncharacterized protein n=1 Tax=Panaeolus cyanescens TaxID=181874 RepID=A0A409YL61_9AGAR|nr:hypothetical protein CVT24_007364 [Panaeolus cyanescens]